LIIIIVSYFNVLLPQRLSLVCSKFCTTLHRASSLDLKGDRYKLHAIDLSKFSRLRCLALVHFTPFTFTGLTTLTQLRNLLLGGGFPEVIDYCHFPTLDTLHILYERSIEDECLISLFKQLSNIKCLSITLNDEAVSLSPLTQLQKLESFRIIGNFIKPKQFKYLQYLSSLTKLEFYQFSIMMEHCDRLPTLTALQVLRLGKTASTWLNGDDYGLQCIADSFPNLVSLSYYPLPTLPNNITQLKKLEYLAFLEFNPTNSITILSALPKLTYLTTVLGEEQWEQLTALTQLKILRCFNAYENTMSFPHLKILDSSDGKFPVGML
jgi:hypothetical protein